MRAGPSGQGIKMRRIAGTIAAVGFFALAAAASLNGVGPFDAAWRALAGAAGLYVLCRIAGKVVIGIVVDAAVDGGGTDAAKEGRIENAG